jgi:transposase
MIRNYVGIDMAATSFVAARPLLNNQWKTQLYKAETDEQLADFIATLDAQADHCVVEATGRYHHRLVAALGEAGIAVSVVNPLSVKRYSQMLGSTAKTDKQDAIRLAKYAQQQQPKAYVHRSEGMQQLSQKRMVINKLEEQAQALRNQRHALEQEPYIDAQSLSILDQQVASLEAHLAELRRSLDQLVAAEYADSAKLLLAIPGFGAETVRVFLEAVSGFEGWQDAANAKAFVKWCGLAPSVHESGKSVRGSGQIGRSGVPWLRQKLWLPCLTLACRMKADTPFKALYVRLKAAGKSHKEALVAVMHKLVRVGLAVLRTGVAYNACFLPLSKENLAISL